MKQFEILIRELLKFDEMFQRSLFRSIFGLSISGAVFHSGNNFSPYSNPDSASLDQIPVHCFVLTRKEARIYTKRLYCSVFHLPEAKRSTGLL